MKGASSSMHALFGVQAHPACVQSIAYLWAGCMLLVDAVCQSSLACQVRFTVDTYLDKQAYWHSRHVPLNTDVQTTHAWQEKGKDYTLWREVNEKPGNTPDCPNHTCVLLTPGLTAGVFQ